MLVHGCELPHIDFFVIRESPPGAATFPTECTGRAGTRENRMPHIENQRKHYIDMALRRSAWRGEHGDLLAGSETKVVVFTRHFYSTT
jgi:hypothetical protein